MIFINLKTRGVKHKGRGPESAWQRRQSGPLEGLETWKMINWSLTAFPLNKETHTRGSFQNTKCLFDRAGKTCSHRTLSPRSHTWPTQLPHIVFIFKLQLGFILQDLLLAFHLHPNLNHCDGVSVIFKHYICVSTANTCGSIVFVRLHRLVSRHTTNL